MRTLFIALLVFVPLAIGASFAGVSAVIVFFLSALSIVPLAKYIGESTEELASRTSPAVGGLLNASFGNATELIIGIFALKAGLIDVVKASIAGSVIGSLLLVLGLSMFWGGWSREKQTFNKTGILAQSSTLFLATIALIVPAIFFETGGETEGAAVQSLSLLVSLVLKEMRQTLGPGSLFGGDTSDIYGGMFDQFLGQAISHNGGFGIAAQIQRQLAQQTGSPPSAAEVRK